MNRSSFFSLAACRTRSRPWDAPSRLGVRSVPPCPAFSLAPALGSPAPRPVARLRSSASRLLWRDLTSHARASSASARRLPDADLRLAPTAKRAISRFPNEELAHMPGSATSRDRRCARIGAHLRVAFRRDKSVGVPIDNFAARWLAYAFPCRRSAPASRPKTHGSGPVWFATPSPQWTSTTYSPPASRRTVTVIPRKSVMSQKSNHHPFAQL